MLSTAVSDWAAWSGAHSTALKNPRCLALQNVQGLAIDAARSNVEKHYVYIQEACADFMRRYRAQVLPCCCVQAGVIAPDCRLGFEKDPYARLPVSGDLHRMSCMKHVLLASPWRSCTPCHHLYCRRQRMRRC